MQYPMGFCPFCVVHWAGGAMVSRMTRLVGSKIFL
jgi:tRNA A37 methylthiotransferase MiaB